MATEGVTPQFAGIHDETDDIVMSIEAKKPEKKAPTQAEKQKAELAAKVSNYFRINI
jgi:hypothetical protein